jgi:hypothetical protein
MFFRKIFGKKPKPPPPPELREFSLDSLGEEIISLRARKLEAAKGAVKPKVDEVAWICEEIKASIEALARAEAAREVYVGLGKTAHEARRLLVDKLNRAVKGIKPPREPTWKIFVAFDDSLSRALSLMNDAIVAHGRYVAVLFGQQMQNVSRSIHKLNGSAAGLKGVIAENNREIELFDGISSKIARQRDLLQLQTHMRAQKESLDGRVKELENTVKVEGAELDRLVNSQELKQVENVRNELNQIERKITKIRGEASSAISNLGRPFKKMKKLALDGKHPLGRNKLRMLDLCIDEPLKAFLSEGENMPELTALLQDLEGIIKKEEIKINPRERRKKLAHIRAMIDGGLLDLKRRLGRALEEKAGKERAYATSSLLKQKAELEKSLEAHRSKLGKIKSELNGTVKEMEKTEEEIKRNGSELEGEASMVFGIKLKIT